MSNGKATGVFFFNLVLLIAISVSALYWVGYHTELLGVIGGLLGLGGVFAWIAIVAHLIKDDRKEILQNAFDTILSRPLTSVICLIFAALLAIVAGLYGSIQIDSRRDTDDRFIEIIDLRALEESNGGDENTKPAYHTELARARSKRNFPVFTGFGFEGRMYEVRADGLPALQKLVTGYSRTELSTPDAFLRKNILLIRPDSELSQTIKKAVKDNALDVHIGRGDSLRSYSLQAYRGESVWVGCEETVSIPEKLREAWRLELLAQKAPQANMLGWLAPLSLAKEESLKRGEPIEIHVKYQNEDPWIVVRSVVEDCGEASCFPQEVVLKMPVQSQDESE